MKNKGKTIWTNMALAIVVLAALIGLHTLSVVSVYALPNGNIEENFLEAQGVIGVEGDYPLNGSDEGGAFLDNYTDRIMFETTRKYDDMSNLFNGLMNRGYARYWHGYITWLRPLFSHVGIYRVREIIVVVNALLMFLAVALISRRFGLKTGICFGLTLIAFRTTYTFYSLQYFTCYFMMYIGVIITTLFYKKESDLRFLLYFYIVVGSITNFLDLLTFPLVTLSMPLVIMMLVEIYEKKTPIIAMFGKIIFASMCWGLSYGITWASKWIITKYSLKSGVLENALNQAKFRMVGDENYVIDRVKAVKGNILTGLFLDKFLLSVVPWIILILIVVVLKKWKELARLSPMILIGIMPYVWYEALCNHSIQHRMFTYRSQMGTMFAIFLIFAYIIFPLKKKKEEK